MKSMMLDTTSVWSYILIAVVVLLLIAMPIVMNARNKKETQKVQEQTNSLKVGDKVLTTSGVYGTITEIQFDDAKKAVVLETGGKEKSYLTIDAYAIYTVFKSDAQLAREAEEKAEAERQAQEAERAKKEAKKAKKNKKTDPATELEEVSKTQATATLSESEDESASEEAKTEKTKKSSASSTKTTKTTTKSTSKSSKGSKSSK